jgi:hypothetical protein
MSLSRAGTSSYGLEVAGRLQCRELLVLEDETGPRASRSRRPAFGCQLTHAGDGRTASLTLLLVHHRIQRRLVDAGRCHPTVATAIHALEETTAARERAAVEELPVHFEVADAEDLPSDDDSFDAVLSTCGVMFAPASSGLRPGVPARGAHRDGELDTEQLGR